ncbi:MAG: hypothetical protein ACHBMF_07400 [Chromatiales bacterium]
MRRVCEVIRWRSLDGCACNYKAVGQYRRAGRRRRSTRRCRSSCRSGKGARIPLAPFAEHSIEIYQSEQGALVLVSSAVSAGQVESRVFAELTVILEQVF